MQGIGKCHFKLIPRCFWSTIRVYQISSVLKESTVVKNFQYRSVLIGRAEGQKMVVGISNLLYVVVSPTLAPIPNFIQIGQKTQELVIFSISRFW